MGIFSKEASMPDERIATTRHADHIMRKAKTTQWTDSEEPDQNARAAAEKAKRTIAAIR